MVSFETVIHLISATTTRTGLKIRARLDKRVYATGLEISAVTDADAKFGLIYDAARQALGANALVIFTSDHGPQWPFGKWNLYDAGIRVPFIAAWPGAIQPGAKTDAMISWIDVLPTLVEIAGGDPPNDLDGRSFAAVLRGQQREHRDRIFTTHSGDGNWNVYPMRALRDRRWKYILNLHPEFEYNTHINLAKPQDGLGYWVSWMSAAANNSRAAGTVRRYHQRPDEELYDLQNDPDEQRNLAGASAQDERRATMRAELESWMKAQGDQKRIYGEPALLEAKAPE